MKYYMVLIVVVVMPISENQRAIAQEGLGLRVILELVPSDDVTLDANTIISQSTGFLAGRESHKPDTVAKVLEARAFAYSSLGMHALAKSDLDDLCKLQPNNIYAICARAEAHAQLKDWAAARADSEKAFKLAPKQLAPNFSMAARRAQEGRLGDAHAFLDTATRVDPKAAGVYYLRAKLFEASDDRDKCVEAIDRCLVLAPTFIITHSDLLMMRGRALVALNRPREGIVALLAARKLNPSGAATRRLLNDLSGAYSTLPSAIHASYYYACEYARLAPNSVVAQANLALSSAKIGDQKQAIAAADRALALAPGSAILMATLGDTYHYLGRYADAGKFHERALALDLEDPTVVMHLATFLATCPDAKYRDGARAVSLIRRQYDRGRWRKWQRWVPLRVLAESYAEAGKFDEAVRFAKECIEVAGSECGRRDELLARLATYQEHKAWRTQPAVGAATK